MGMYERNRGYVSDKAQEKLASLRVLIAGCGIGSSIAEPLLRLGVRHFVLLDGDHVEEHNLNRQNYVAKDVSVPKVSALAERLLAISPDAIVEQHSRFLDEGNVEELVSTCDVVFDTIDFVDLPAIVALHDEAHRQGKPVFSAFAAAFGAAAVYFAPDGAATIRDLLGLPSTGSVRNVNFARAYGALLTSLAPRLDPSILAVMSEVLPKLMEGKACPAPAVSAGSASLAALTTTLLSEWAEEHAIAEAPHVMILNVRDILRPARSPMLSDIHSLGGQSGESAISASLRS